MDDTVIIMGCGVKIDDLIPLLNMAKLARAAMDKYQTPLNVEVFGGLSDMMGALQCLDTTLQEDAGGLCQFFEDLAPDSVMNFWENNNSEFFMVYTRHFPWEEPAHAPQSFADVQRRIVDFFLPYLKDGVEASSIMMEVYNIEDIT